MKRVKFAACALLLLAFTPAPGQTIPDSQRLQVKELAGQYLLTVPLSRLEMRIPKGRLSRAQNTGGAADSPRYFIFEDKQQRVFVSGWFEPDNFSGVPKFWESETAAWKRRNLPEPRDVSFEKQASWEVIVYDLEVPSERSSHIRAHWVQAGTWIDIHISVAADLPKAERRNQVRELLKAIQVSEKR